MLNSLQFAPVEVHTRVWQVERTPGYEGAVSARPASEWGDNTRFTDKETGVVTDKLLVSAVSVEQACKLALDFWSMFK